ncbi:hypothetical protein JXL83_10140 [candidate division WOR-3 bacterium]|nr:hypothetical protein [candidate division WOR-3 bacterium]
MIVKTGRVIERNESINVLYTACVNARLISEKTLEEYGKENIDSVFKDIFGGQKLRYILYDDQGNVLADSKLNTVNNAKIPLKSAFYQALRVLTDSHENSRYYGYSQTASSASLALPFYYEKNLKGVILVEGDPDIIYPKAAYKLYFAAFGLIVFSSLAALFLCTGTIIKTIDSIRISAEAARKNSTEILLYGKERMLLGEKFSYFFTAMQDEEKPNVKTSELFSSLNSIADGLPSCVLIIDGTGRIVFTNKTVKATFLKNYTGDYEGKYYREIFQSEELLKMLKKAETAGEASGEVEIFNLVCLVSVKYQEIDKSKYSIVSIQDITEQKAAEHRQNRFIINTAHELKTPLSIVMGFAEILESESEENKSKFICIINKNLNRLNNLVKDLLLLAQSDDPGFLYDFKKTDIKIIADETMIVFEQKAKEKNISLNKSFSETDFFVYGDDFLLGQLLVNLVDNSIKYNKVNGEVLVSLSKREGMIFLSVKDTGIGIPEKHRKNIFSRFYTVNKSRSRETGGTGLGLSIVKSIADRHSAYVSFDSEIDVGTVFTVSFPEYKN